MPRKVAKWDLNEEINKYTGDVVKLIIVPKSMGAEKRRRLKYMYLKLFFCVFSAD